MTENKQCNFFSKVPAGSSQLEILAFPLDLCACDIGISLRFVEDEEQGHGPVDYLLISGLLPQEYIYLPAATQCPNIFIVFIPTDTHGDLP
jgi:hypothetical protein